MAFGMHNVLATFQHLMNVALSSLLFCEAYLDDLVVCSESWVEHLEQLHTVFYCLKEAGLTVNLSKCELGQATVTYFGKVVGGGQVRPVQAKVECIEAFPVPTTRIELIYDFYDLFSNGWLLQGAFVKVSPLPHL